MRTAYIQHEDRQRIAPTGCCTCCGRELYPRQPRWRLWGQVLCRDCAVQRAMEALAPYRSAGEEAGR